MREWVNIMGVQIVNTKNVREKRCKYIDEMTGVGTKWKVGGGQNGAGGGAGENGNENVSPLHLHPSRPGLSSPQQTLPALSSLVALLA